MRVQKISMLAVAGVALGLSLTACGGGSHSASPASSTATAPTQPRSSAAASAPASVAASVSALGRHSTPAKAAGTAKKSGVSCTNRINYAGDPRSNAEINSIGEDTGYCPPVKH
nr:MULTISPECIES: hypothetical protein [Streptomyces]